MGKPPHYLPHNKDNTKICSSCGAKIDVWPEHVRACESCWKLLTAAERITVTTLTRIDDYLRQQNINAEHDRADDSLSIQFSRIGKALERLLVDSRIQSTSLVAVVEKLLARIEAIPVAQNNVTKPPPPPSTN